MLHNLNHIWFHKFQASSCAHVPCCGWSYDKVHGSLFSNSLNENA